MVEVMINRKWFLLLLMLVFAVSCTMPHVKPAKARGVYHRVKSGETLWQIAKAYRIDLQTLAEVNNITDPNVINADSVLFIPDANQAIDDIIKSADVTATPPEKRLAPPASPQLAKPFQTPPVAAAPREEDMIVGREMPKVSSSIKEEDIGKESAAAKIPVSDVEPKPLPAPPPAAKPPDASATKNELKSVAPIKEKETVNSAKQPAAMTAPKESVLQKEPAAINSKQNVEFDKNRFIWPLQGKVISRFGIQPNGMYLNGIKIAAREGTAVVASAAGTVIFSSPLKGYGDTVIIKHEDDFATVYTNLYDRAVSVEDRVKRGEKIALLRKSDKESQPYLSFEIRQNNKARNPLFFLP